MVLHLKKNKVHLCLCFWSFFFGLFNHPTSNLKDLKSESHSTEPFNWLYKVALRWNFQGNSQTVVVLIGFLNRNY